MSALANDFPLEGRVGKWRTVFSVFNDIQVFWCSDCLQKHKENSRESYGTKEYKLLYATAHFKDCEQQRRHLSESHSLANNCRVKEQTCTKITRLSVVTMPKIAYYTGKWFLTTSYSDHIQGDTLFQTALDQERGIIGPASLLHSWHWVLFFSVFLSLFSNRTFFPFLVLVVCTWTQSVLVNG